MMLARVCTFSLTNLLRQPQPSPSLHECINMIQKTEEIEFFFPFDFLGFVPVGSGSRLVPYQTLYVLNIF